MDYDHENDSESCDCLDNRLFCTCILPADSFHGEAGPIVPLGHYCLSYDLGGTDCSFKSYAQCQATASGLAAECYGKTTRDDEHERPWGAGRGRSLR